MKVGWWQAGLHYEAETDEEHAALIAQGEAAIAAGASPLWDPEELRRSRGVTTGQYTEGTWEEKHERA